jgi:hypothetical protein
MAKLWLEWNSTTTQEARNKANDDLNYVKTSRIFARQYENEEQFAAKWRKLWLEWNSTTTQQARKPERNQQQGRKYEDRLEKSVHNGTYVA